MRTHNGMRPQDIVILLKIANWKDENLQLKSLASTLYLSNSEISESVARSHIAGLIAENKKTVHRQALLEFIRYGLQYVFPQVPGTMITGMPTAHSHPFYAKRFKAEFAYVWPDDNGSIRGLAVQPLYPNLVKAAKEDECLYLQLASIDIIRIGRMREINIAFQQLEKSILLNP